MTAVLKGDNSLLRVKREDGGRRASVRDFHSLRVTWVTSVNPDLVTYVFNLLTPSIIFCNGPMFWSLRAHAHVSSTPMMPRNSDALDTTCQDHSLLYFDSLQLLAKRGFLHSASWFARRRAIPLLFRGRCWRCGSLVVVDVPLSRRLRDALDLGRLWSDIAWPRIESLHPQ